MNKDKLVEKLKKMKEYAQRFIVAKPSDTLDEIQNDISNGYITAIDEINDYIQSEPEDVTDTNVGKIKTNFDMITESSEKLAVYLENIVRNAEEDNDYCIAICQNFHSRCFDKGICKDGILKNLNQKAGE